VYANFIAASILAKVSAAFVPALSETSLPSPVGVVDGDTRFTLVI